MVELPKSARRVQKVLGEFGLKSEVKILPESTRTSKAAADVLGCEIGQIAKSIVFDSESNPILVIASGKNRISTKKLEALVNEKVKIMDPTKVKKVTGFGIGGIPPVAHKTRMEVFIDEDLLEYDIVWGAAGVPESVLPMKPKDLVRITGGKVVDVKE